MIIYRSVKKSNRRTNEFLRSMHEGQTRGEYLKREIYDINRKGGGIIKSYFFAALEDRLVEEGESVKLPGIIHSV